MASRPVYKSNPARPWRANHGLKRMDDLSGAWSYEDFMTTDDDANTIDARDRRTFDRRYDLDGDNR